MIHTFAEINLSNLKHNFLAIRKKVGNKKIMAVVKADAYGHGVDACVGRLNLLEAGPEYYGVAFVEEAIGLRKINVEQPIHVFAPVTNYEINHLSRYDLITSVFDDSHIKIILNSGNKLKVHIKVDTGMGRLGVHHSKAVDYVIKVVKNKLHIDGIYTHFATADEKDKTFANIQIERFAKILDELKKKGIDYGYAHAANSGAVLDLPDSYFDMVRPGIALYGNYPSLETSESIKLKPVMSLVSVVANVKELYPGDSVSYGRKFIAKEKTRIISVPLGYADGFSRGLSDNSECIIKGKKYKQVGRVCMDRTMFEIGFDRVKENDKVILIGKYKGLEINAWDWSKALNTIPYEVTCNISKRVPRIFVD